MKRIYLDLHVLQTVPPSCVNRDDTGSPKTAIYGGATRARVSSQAWKHAMREEFRDELLGESDLGVRTKKVGNLIKEKIQMMKDVSDDDAMKMAKEILGKAGIKVSEDKKTNDLVTGTLFFISDVQANKLAELAINGETDSKVVQAALKENPSIDIALFGRMVAEPKELTNDACSQVAHAISTHAIQNEYDYFTAVDEYSSEENSGAGHLGTTEYNSSTLYRYATVNITELKNKIGDKTEEAIIAFVKAFALSMPTGKQNSFANRTFPDDIYLAIRTDQPVNLCGAFEKPIRASENGYVAPSEKRFVEYANNVYQNYAGRPKKEFVVGQGFNELSEPVSFNDMLAALERTLSELEEA